MRTRLLALAAAHLAAAPAAAQQQPPPDIPVTVENGVLRWSATGEEVALFGVNYTTPFAYAYRAHGYDGAAHREAIDADVSHLARLGVEAYRVHVWDREISDRQGNLVENRHLELLDYLIARLQERGIKIVLTPIFWGGTGYPERNPPTGGFSEDYGKGEMTVSPEARRIQARYLQQFVRHLNPHTGRTYADDPGIIAFEIFNEPNHPGGPEETTRYIDEMVQALREAGLRKPIFYNVTIGWSDAHARAVCSADIQGITFQWYPSGLVRNGSVRANLLPHVAGYPIPFGQLAECRDRARLVYEFDAADAMGAYLYPAMARSFRAAGMQWATQFAYDPLALAHVNTEYQTHYLNLVYTPQKAIGFLIAGEAFRRLPRGGSFGTYPENNRFGAFRVSHEQELSEMLTAEAFYHSNSTDSRPLHPDSLRRIAGFGTSPLVRYEGRGAYFLDRLEAGVWRLEVYPDAVHVDDPFGRASLEREVTRLLWREWPIDMGLPDLGPDFTVRGVDRGNALSATASGGRFTVRPGVYVLRRAGIAADRWTDPELWIGNRRLGEFHLPARTERPTAVVHRPSLQAEAGRPLEVRAEVASPSPAARVEIWSRHYGAAAFERTEMRRLRGIEYEAQIPVALVREGAVEYAVVVHEEGRARTFPAGRESMPATGGAGGGTAAGDSLWRVPVASPEAPVVLFDASRDRERLLYPHPWRYVRFTTDFVSQDDTARSALRVNVESFEPAPHHFAVRSFLGEENRTRLQNAAGLDRLTIRARAPGSAAERLEVALVERDGTAWGTVVELSGEWREISVPVSALRPTSLVLLPRPYPEFLPDRLQVDPPAARSLEIANLEGVQLRIGAELYDSSQHARPHGFEIEKIVISR